MTAGEISGTNDRKARAEADRATVQIARNERIGSGARKGSRGPIGENVSRGSIASSDRTARNGLNGQNVQSGWNDWSAESGWSGSNDSTGAAGNPFVYVHAASRQGGGAAAYRDLPPCEAR